jgi:hypothetical protein
LRYFNEVIDDDSDETPGITLGRAITTKRTLDYKPTARGSQFMTGEEETKGGDEWFA